MFFPERSFLDGLADKDPSIIALIDEHLPVEISCASFFNRAYGVTGTPYVEILRKYYKTQGEMVDAEGRRLLHKLGELDKSLSLDLAKALLDAGNDPNVGDNLDLTPLFYAANAEMIRLLVSRGADMNHRSGGSPLLLSLCRQNILYGPKIGQPLTERVAIIQTLLDCGADANVKTEYGNALHQCVDSEDKSSSLAIFKLLLQSGTDPTFRGKFSGTAWDYAESKGRKDILALRNSVAK